jgi:hypothetical protein
MVPKAVVESFVCETIEAHTVQASKRLSVSPPLMAAMLEKATYSPCSLCANLNETFAYIRQ